jgi:hypothetical protein
VSVSGRASRIEGLKILGGGGRERERVDRSVPSAGGGGEGGEARSLDPAALERYRGKRGLASGPRHGSQARSYCREYTVYYTLDGLAEDVVRARGGVSSAVLDTSHYRRGPASRVIKGASVAIGL